MIFKALQGLAPGHPSNFISCFCIFCSFYLSHSAISALPEHYTWLAPASGFFHLLFLFPGKLSSWCLISLRPCSNDLSSRGCSWYLPKVTLSPFLLVCFYSIFLISIYYCPKTCIFIYPCVSLLYNTDSIRPKSFLFTAIFSVPPTVPFT